MFKDYSIKHMFWCFKEAPQRDFPLSSHRIYDLLGNTKIKDSFGLHIT